MKKKIALIQADIKFRKNDENYQNLLNLMNLAMAEKPDFIVLPETLNCGFFTSKNLVEFCDKDGSKTKEIFSKFAKQNSVNIVAGSVMNLKNDKIYNSSFIFDRNGKVIATYDKIHTFSPAREDEIITSGENYGVFELDGVKCAVAICYDLRFGDFIKSLCGAGQGENSEKNRADLLFIPAQWDEKRINHWKILNFARAVENQIFVCSVNGSGEIINAKGEKKGKFGGNSLLISPNGDEILNLGEFQSVKTAMIDLDEIQQIRAKIDISKDTKFKISKDF
ncbi:MAG: hypothetical protein II923_03605 [Campylobacter sp.]|nr:hypothetical protein [Campylobacter sp.]